MGTELNFTCACGEVAGVLIDPGPQMGDHVVCHCTDCQNLTHYLGAADRVLQAHGGTELYMGRCAKMRLTKGADKLACLHLTYKPTLRWYASCCRSPLFNSFGNGRMPYLSLLLANCDKKQVEPMLGPVTGHVFLPKSLGDLPQAPRMSVAKLMRRNSVRIVKDWLSGDRRRSAIYDPQTLAPIATPYRLTEAEQRALAARGNT